MSEVDRLAKQFRTLNSISFGLLIISVIGYITFFVCFLFQNSILSIISFSIAVVSMLINGIAVVHLEHKVIRKILEETNRHLNNIDGQ